MPTGRLELLIEPFRENAPGPHVTSVIDLLDRHDVEVDMGPFSTTVGGDLDLLTQLAPKVLETALQQGATSVEMRLERGEALGHRRTEGLHGALERLVGSVERELDSPLAEMDRSQKQAAVRRLDEQGAFLLRGAVEDVAATMGVSRVTLYSYLNAIERSGR